VIYVKRDDGLIPLKIKKVAERAQEKLERLPAADRASFIKRKAHIWHAFRRYLSKMSYGKCWYSESIEPQSFSDVDHYRPKLEAKRSDSETDPGYEWLAFSWSNFRFSAQRSNRPNKNEDTGSTDGKGSWFPLLDGSPRATWGDRCENTEQPVLLDPVKKADVRLIDVRDDARMGPSLTCIGTARLRVERSIEVYGLNLPGLKEARLRVMREINELYAILAKTLEAGGMIAKVADSLPIDQQVEVITKKTHPSSAYSKAARSQLIRLGAGALCLQPEELVDS